MDVTGREFRNVMGEFATGVTVVTARNAVDGNRFGFTANSVTSVSLDPPLILVCVGKDKFAHKILSENEFFGVNILCREQNEVAVRFAGREPNRFDGLETIDGESGAPLIKGANGTLECQRTEILEGGDHSIIIGRVKKVTHDPASDPLVFFRGAFCCVADV